MISKNFENNRCLIYLEPLVDKAPSVFLILASDLFFNIVAIPAVSF